MSLPGVLRAVLSISSLGEALSGPAATLSSPAASRPFVVAGLAARGPVLALTATTREAEDLVAALESLHDQDRVAFFPPWETLPHERLSPRADTIGRRLAVLRRLAHPSKDDPTTGPLDIVVAPVRSVLQPIPKGLGELAPVNLRSGDDVGLEATAQRLIEIGYGRVDLVEKRGEFALRGGILDVFPPTEEHPLRVEFFGDEVEEIRYFAVADQRSLEVATHGLWAPPCRELLLTESVRERARALSSDHPELAELLNKVAEGIPAEGMESLTPALMGSSDELELFVAAMPQGTHVVMCDPERVRTRAHDLVETSAEFLQASWSAAATGAQAPIDLGASAFRNLDEVQDTAKARELSWWALTPFRTLDDATVDQDESSTIPPAQLQAAPSYRGDITAAFTDIASATKRGDAVVLVFVGHGSAQRAVEQLSDAGLGATLAQNMLEAPKPGSITVTTGAIEAGLSASGLLLLTEQDLTGARAPESARRKMPSRRRNAVDPLALKPGDFVVHEQHGVGKYVEMIRRTLNGGEREYLVLEYASSKRGQPGDRLFVPTDSLDQLTRYVGGEAPTLHRMGGADWQKSKSRARKAVKEIAAELVRLYAARVGTPGYAFAPDTPWQRELEDAFPFTETPDQLAAINEVKSDMEKPHPMDRVICGDVGYGKTEIAVRAAFKAVQDGKQVAILVPTTLLAKQHLGTFTGRMAQFPVRIEQLSRFQTDAEAREVLRGLSEGAVDIVIGTHRLLQNTVRFKDLGLVIVDEEQRFGVEHKEHLKHLRTAVDVLTMSATPIPRTLEMSLTGIREMSTIATPPEERHPVLTYVGAYEERQIAAAIKRELLRDGQVFYLHNRVESIDKAAARIRDLVPEARVEVGHGQMGEDALERVMVGFWEKQYDVLVCTTIVESGLDIPNANTLIVERADNFGLSQLHQIRGRVGRGRERGYGYFMYPPEKPLTETAHERLATIAQHSELGAGMYVAMKDLEIRGAGNLLGGEQSGHIAAIGFDLYVRMVSEAVAEFKGEAPQELAEVKVDLPVDANVPHDYIESERLRLELYRKLAAIEAPERLAEVRDEVLDRYGHLPTQVENLFAVAAFRLKARGLGVSEVAIQGRNIRLSPVKIPDSRVMRLQRYYPGSTYKQAAQIVTVPAPTTARVGGKPIRDAELLNWASKLLDDLLVA